MELDTRLSAGLDRVAEGIDIGQMPLPSLDKLQRSISQFKKNQYDVVKGKRLYTGIF
jgi:hypothetical protein